MKQVNISTMSLYGSEVKLTKQDSGRVSIEFLNETFAKSALKTMVGGESASETMKMLDESKDRFAVSHMHFDLVFGQWLKQVFNREGEAGFRWNYPRMGIITITPVNQPSDELCQVDLQAHVSGLDSQGVRFVFPKEMLK